MTEREEKTELVLMRLDRLYRDLPLEYAGYALSAIQDIENILYAANNLHSDKGYEIGTEEERLAFERNRNERTNSKTY